MIFRPLSLIAAVMPLAVFASNVLSPENVIIDPTGPKDSVNFGGKEMSSAEALEFLSNLANGNGSEEGKEKLPIVPPEEGNELGPLLPESGPEEPKIPLPNIIDPPQSEVGGPAPKATTTKPNKKGGIPNPNESGRLRCQDEKTKLFIPTARACKDERGPLVCETLFSPPDETTGRRDPKCDQPGFEDIAKSCRRQCCEDMAYACEDDDSGLIDCQKNKDKCGVAKWFNVLAQFCAGTCGLCTKTTCKDNNLDCRGMKGLCKNPEHKVTMQSQCALTCKFCIPGVTGNPDVEVPSAPAPAPISGGGPSNANCVDVAKNCKERANLCGHPLYMEHMTKLCAKTCNKCGSQLPLATGCADTNSRCDSWISTGFCTSKYYTTEYKKANCAKSCKLC